MRTRAPGLGQRSVSHSRNNRIPMNCTQFSQLLHIWLTISRRLMERSK
ncbi:unnamed protein product [Medioppia subpectinata]|uniref:Uncharacterized protein n=1 Tax=Medioppia subpectinata TaxID=1979941 RepID=A0A7R9QCL5_9ACAR|nr:unnamed protein product [Medioppia subpectinata]CAG2117946.1 unnamed protein product [Medioppia subpectinata]